MSSNAFVLDTKEYKRDIDVLRHYIHDQALYLSIETGDDYDTCLEFAKRKSKELFVDPEVYYLERNEHSDRIKKKSTLSKYIGSSVRERELIAPTFTTYTPPHKKEALLVKYIDTNVKMRGVAKKAMFKAQVAGDMPTFRIKKIEQTNRKLANNAISGAHVDASNPLSNKTAHSTLTSNCRTTSGYGNANNEKFLSGNRHYFNPDIVRNNIISIINHTDYVQMEEAMRVFGIRAPSVEETMDCIEYSAKLYWTTKAEYTDIRRTVSKLTDMQRAAFVYTGDLYHLMKYNDPVVREFISRLSKRIDVPHPDPSSVIDNAPDDYVHLAAQICPAETKGKDLKKLVGTEAYGIVASTVENIINTLQDYKLLIRAFWVTTNVPASVAHFPDSIRRSALTSDTDSTIFTVQDWVIWYGGKLGFSQVDCAVSASMIFLAAQAITHVLARMSANFGIEEKRLHQVAMKNEFAFPVFVPTQVAKHYYALISCQEGNLKAEYEKEIKGVHLKSSNAPRVVMTEAKKMMEYIMLQIIEKGSISIDHILKWIGDVERNIIESIAKGSYEYFRIGQIKTPDSYTREADSSDYRYYVMWQEVFAPKYGDAPPPPYMSVKVSTELSTATMMKNWIAKMEDRELADRMTAYLERTGRKNITTFHLPEQCISSKGIPKEIMDVIGVRKIVLDSSKVFYLILETLGVFMLNKKNTRLVSDTH